MNTAQSTDNPTVGGRLRASLQELSTEAKEETARLAAGARDEVRRIVRRRQEDVAERLDDVAAVLRDAGRRLDLDVAGLEATGERAADSIERASDYVRESEMSDMAHDLRHAARRHPAWFIGGSFAVGLLIARYLKSSRRPQLTAAMETEGVRLP